MKLIFLWNSWLLWGPECMDWLVGLMCCLMEGNLWPDRLYFFFLFEHLQQVCILHLCLMNLLGLHVNCLGLQYCTKVAYNCPWCSYNPLVSITLCSVSATLCHGRTRNYWQASHGCPQCSKLYHIFNTVRLFFFSFPFSFFLSCWFVLSVSNNLLNINS